MDSKLQTLYLNWILVVNIFLDVFFENLPRGPPDREIKFRIDMFLDTLNISIPPYRMAPEGLKNLNEKLKDLLYKVFSGSMLLYGVI